MRLGFSKTSVTSAKPAGLRFPEPLKITSIIASPRRDLADCSLSTHLKPSTTLLLPQPLGPTIPVIGESKTNSVRSAKLLKPCRISFFSRIVCGPPCPAHRGGGRAFFPKSTSCPPVPPHLPSAGGRHQ